VYVLTGGVDRYIKKQKTNNNNYKNCMKEDTKKTEGQNKIELKKNKRIDVKLMSFTAVAAIIGAGLAAGVSASAFDGIMGGGGYGFRGGDPEDRDEIMTAIENDDYETWSELVEDQCMQGVTEERFEEMVDRHTSRIEEHDAIEEAIEAGDYDTWLELSSEFDRGRAFEMITEDNFDTYVAMHEATEAGDYETADELRDELGLNVRPQDGTGFQRGGMRRGMMGDDE